MRQKKQKYYHLHIALLVDKDQELIKMIRTLGAVRLLRIMWGMCGARLLELRLEADDEID